MFSLNLFFKISGLKKERNFFFWFLIRLVCSWFCCFDRELLNGCLKNIVFINKKLIKNKVICLKVIFWLFGVKMKLKIVFIIFVNLLLVK